MILPSPFASSGNSGIVRELHQRAFAAVARHLLDRREGREQRIDLRDIARCTRSIARSSAASPAPSPRTPAAARPARRSCRAGVEHRERRARGRRERLRRVRVRRRAARARRRRRGPGRAQRLRTCVAEAGRSRASERRRAGPTIPSAVGDAGSTMRTQTDRPARDKAASSGATSAAKAIAGWCRLSERALERAIEVRRHRAPTSAMIVMSGLRCAGRLAGRRCGASSRYRSDERAAATRRIRRRPDPSIAATCASIATMTATPSSPREPLPLRREHDRLAPCRRCGPATTNGAPSPQRADVMKRDAHVQRVRAPQSIWPIREREERDHRRRARRAPTGRRAVRVGRSFLPQKTSRDCVPLRSRIISRRSL